MIKVCSNCESPYIDGDKYCRFCGSPMGRPIFIQENFACIYGPLPTERKHECEKCKYTWTTDEMIDNERFCPKCGGSAPGVETDNYW